MSDAGIVTLLFTDLVGSTELLERVGDDAAERVRRTHFGLLREAVASRCGEEVKNLGDGLMVVFPSAVEAVGCAVAIQQAVARHNQETGAVPFEVRVGLHVGEPVRDEGDYFGKSVVVAKRLCDAADGGQILASELVQGLVGSRGGHSFRPLGLVTLKGLAEPLATLAVDWERPGAAAALPVALASARGPFVGRQDELKRLRAA
jgi:class 3 adenylate cyclase